MENLESKTVIIEVMVPRLRCSGQALNFHLKISLTPNFEIEIFVVPIWFLDWVLRLGLVEMWSPEFVIQYPIDFNWIWPPFPSPLPSLRLPLLWIYPWAKKLFLIRWSDWKSLHYRNVCFLLDKCLKSGQNVGHFHDEHCNFFNMQKCVLFFIS